MQIEVFLPPNGLAVIGISRAGQDPPLLCPLGEFFKAPGAMMVKPQAAGIEHGYCFLCPGAILVVTHQRVPPAGKLDADLVASACVEPNTHQASVPTAQALIGQPCFFHTAAFFLHHKYFIPSAVLKQQISPISRFRRGSVNQCHIFLDKAALGNLPGQVGCRHGLRA